MFTTTHMTNCNPMIFFSLLHAQESKERPGGGLKNCSIGMVVNYDNHVLAAVSKLVIRLNF